MTDLLQVTDLRMRHGDVLAVDGVSFTLGAGEMLGLVGPNGAGKAAVMDCILGRSRPDAGAVLFDGHAIAGSRPAAIGKRGIGCSGGLPRGFPARSVRDNLVLAGQEQRGRAAFRLFAPGDAALREAAGRMLAHFGLEPVADLPADGLRLAEQKLVDVAMACMAGSRVALLYEPASGLNPAMLAALSERLRALNAERATAMLVIDHNLEFVASLCTRILVMAGGKIVAEGAPQAMRIDPKVIEAYLGN